MAQKRTFDDGPAMETAPDESIITSAMPHPAQALFPPGAQVNGADIQDGGQRQSSPAPSTTSTLSSLSATPSLSIHSQHTPSSGVPISAPATNGPPAKKRKLTPQEKEQYRLEKEAKQREREAQKAQREVEKAEKAEERRQKNEEKEEKRRQRELEQQKKEHERDERRRAKEAEKQREEEEKLKKEKAQSRIMNFFAKPAPSATATSSHTSTPNQHEEKQCNDQDQPINEANIGHAPETKPKTDYERTFLPFQTPLHGKWAKANHFTFDQGAIKFHEQNFDKIDDSDSNPQPQRQVKDLFELAPQQSAPKGYIGPTTKDIMEQLENSSENPTQPTDATSSLRKPLETLRKINVKFLLFHEDVRPPYVGTFTRLRSRAEARRLARQPFRRARDELDYDYDSEAEWEEPEEGEDLDSEGESDSGSEAADEMDDFLDDEEDAADGSRLKRRTVASEMEPIVSGICFEDERGKCLTGSEVAGFDLEGLRLELLDEDASFPIDPFQSASLAETPAPSSILEKFKTAATNTSPSGVTRMPLQTKTNTSFLMPNASIGPPSSRPGPKSTKPAKINPRLLMGAELEQFKAAVSGSQLPKGTLLGVLKVDFKKTPHEVLKDTLEAFAQQVGKKRDEKKWVIVGDQA